MRHYLTVTDSDFDRATKTAQKPAHMRHIFRRSQRKPLFVTMTKRRRKPLQEKHLGEIRRIATY